VNAWVEPDLVQPVLLEALSLYEQKGDLASAEAIRARIASIVPTVRS
jgi:hypothetical protein